MKQDEALQLVSEECAEVIQAISKIQRLAFKESSERIFPQLKEDHNLEILLELRQGFMREVVQEMGDLLEVMELAGITPEDLQAARLRKRRKMVDIGVITADDLTTKQRQEINI